MKAKDRQISPARWQRSSAHLSICASIPGRRAGPPGRWGTAAPFPRPRQDFPQKPVPCALVCQETAFLAKPEMSAGTSSWNSPQRSGGRSRFLTSEHSSAFCFVTPVPSLYSHVSPVSEALLGGETERLEADAAGAGVGTRERLRSQRQCPGAPRRHSLSERRPPSPGPTPPPGPARPGPVCSEP